MSTDILERSQKGAIELIALGLLAALIIVLALPIFSDILGPESSTSSLNSTGKN